MTRRPTDRPRSCADATRSTACTRANLYRATSKSTFRIWKKTLADLSGSVETLLNEEAPP
jgi:hypothetical protein